MNGAGNDFILFDARAQSLALDAVQIRALANRAHPITHGCDQLLVLEPPHRGGTAFMRIFNADGGEVAACGNGTRAAAKLLDMPHVIIETMADNLACTQDSQGMITVNMGRPHFGWQQIPLTHDAGDLTTVTLHPDLPPAFLVNIGNPHAVLFVDNPADAAQNYGQMLEHHALFSEGANINFAHILPDESLELHVWERGVGLTKACGTGACATTVAYMHRHKGEGAPETTLHLPGGDLYVRYADEIFLSGPVVHDFTACVAL